MSIKGFLKSHEDWVLVFSTIVLASVVVVFFGWGVTFLAKNVGRALETPSNQPAGVEFHIGDANKLDFRGLSGF